ncbi:MAG: hypothetical protein L0Z55_12560 [Planctomycetes bacterium]|nr:hypothetical protein [Planctomycetota bacterium]
MKLILRRVERAAPAAIRRASGPAPGPASVFARAAAPASGSAHRPVPNSTARAVRRGRGDRLNVLDELRKAAHRSIIENAEAHQGL